MTVVPTGTEIVGGSKRKFWIRISAVGGLLAVAALDAQGDAHQDATRQTQLPPVAPVSPISSSSHVTSFTGQYAGKGASDWGSGLIRAE